MANEPNRHHYVPEFYLSGFTRDGSRDTKLWIHDLTDGHSFEARPMATGFQRKLYRVDVGDGGDPNFLEKALSQLEGSVVPVIRQIDERAVLPEGDAFNLLMNFIALLFARVPQYKNLMANMAETMHRKVLELAVSSPEAFESTRRRMLADGYGSAAKMTYEQMKEFIDRGEFEIPLPQQEYVRLLMGGMDSALRPLAARRWSIVRFHDCPDKLICSDNPVNLEWITDQRPRWMSPGLAVPGTEVLVPLTRQSLLVGTFEGDETVSSGSREMAAIANGRVANRATRFLFHSEEEFILADPSGRILQGSEVISRIVREQASDD